MIPPRQLWSTVRLMVLFWFFARSYFLLEQAWGGESSWHNASWSVTHFSNSSFLSLICRTRFPLECVQKAMPVSNLVNNSSTSIIKIQGATGHCFGQNIAAILDIVRSRATSIDTRIRQGAESKNARCQVIIGGCTPVPEGASCLSRWGLEIGLEVNV